MNNNPILNSPYEEPKLHYHTNDQGELDYESVEEGRRVFKPKNPVVPTKQGPQKEIFEVNDLAEEYGTHLVNLVRKEIGQWRDSGYPNTTRVTKELLDFWFNNPERHAIKKLFFAQREAVETAIWLNEVAERSNAGQNILNKIKSSQKEVSNRDEFQLPRIAFKMATGTGKTVVMATLIVYHYFNRQEYRQDTRFADNFLIVAPGITIKDRLGVLFVDKKSANKNQREDYYAVRDLVPRKLEPKLANINSKLVITNYHSFEARTLKGNKKSPFDGKIIGHDDKGKPIKQEAKEDTNQVIKRVFGNFKKGSRLLVLNDEAHHCYLPKEKGRTKDTEGDENAKAAVWFSGLAELKKEFKLTAVYDLSATPYYLQGSGYEPYSLFGWVVSDFGLIEAIESGLVKIPYLPESDNTQELTMPVLRNLYEHVKDELPRKGRRTQRKEAKEEGRKISEAPPKIPHLVKGALDQFYSHYKDYADNMREKGEAAVELFTRPPVFIAVCNNTAVSKEVYKFVAGYEYEDEKGEVIHVPGNYDLFSNYDQTGRLKRKSPTLLIDSEALDNADQVNSEGFYQDSDGKERKAYFHIGPKFGTVAKKAVNEAVKSCRQRGDADWLIILGFSFESDIANQNVTMSVGSFEVTKVRMHDDLMQEGLLKKDKKAASFVTIGEPDIKLHKEGEEATVEVKGLDIYDPIKDQVKARNVEDIAYWMVDDDYDGNNFVVKQIFFCGGKKDEFKKWKKGLSDLAKTKRKKDVERTLKIEIDEGAFDRLYGFQSHPFNIKSGQKVAVRVISQFGEESTKVLSL